jgi:ferritin
MITNSLLAAVNQQILHEQSNAHAYQAVSLYFGRVNLHGLEAFMAQQVVEERMHASKLIQHVNDRGGRVELGAIPAPKADFVSPLEAAESVQALERTTTETINQLYEMACNEDWRRLNLCRPWSAPPLRQSTSSMKWLVTRATTPCRFCYTGISPSRLKRKNGRSS